MNEQNKLRQIKSPCVSICQYNHYSYCVGCKRHMHEIFDWFDFTDEMRTAIMNDLTKRDIATLKLPPSFY